MYSELYEIYHQELTKIWRNSSSFGRALKANLTPLHNLGIEKRNPQNKLQYCFAPSPEQLEACKNSYSDSANRSFRGDPADLREPEEVVSSYSQAGQN